VKASGVPVGENPLGIAAAEGVLSLLVGAMFFLFIPLALAAQASLVVRFRRARGDERQQLKWLAYAILSFLAYLLLLPAFSLLVFGHGPSELVVDLLESVALLAVPVALGVAVLRYRLYDIDRLINRTLVYGHSPPCSAPSTPAWCWSSASCSAGWAVSCRAGRSPAPP
jgi:hypothetical protein